MRHLITFILVTLAVFLGSAGLSVGAEPIKGLCLTGTKHSHLPIAGKCSASYEKGDYGTALREFQPLAEQGGASVQFNLDKIKTRLVSIRLPSHLSRALLDDDSSDQ